MFPIMSPMFLSERRALAASGVDVLMAIPWEMIAKHEAQAQRNHGQSLDVLASRGGLSAREAVAVLEDRPWQNMDCAKAYRRLHELFVAAAEAA
jgi:uncharacterized protein (DUF1501 family)